MSGSGLMGQIGVAHESAYGTYVAPTRWVEGTEQLQPDRGRVRIKTPRAGARVIRRDRVAVYDIGASGTVTVPVLSRGFGIWLRHILGTVATTGPNDDGAYTHTATIGSLRGDSFTLQSGLPYADSTVAPKTLLGGKITQTVLKCAVDQELSATFTCDFKQLEIDRALASAAYSSSIPEVLTFVGGRCEISGTEVPITEFEVTIGTPFKMRRYLGGTKAEPLESDYREITWKVTADWDNLTQANRIMGATATDTQAAIVLEFAGVEAIAGTTYPSLTINLNLVDFLAGLPNLEGTDVLMQALSGDLLAPAGGSAPMSIVYVSADSTAA